MAGVSYVDLPGFIDQVDRRGLCAASMVPILTLRSEAIAEEIFAKYPIEQA